jgi:hypothetical protein
MNDDRIDDGSDDGSDDRNDHGKGNGAGTRSANAQNAQGGAAVPRRASDRELLTASATALLLRIAAWCSVVASIVVLIAPGMRGYASQWAVEAWDFFASFFAYGMFGLLMAVVVLGLLDLVRTARLDRASRAVAIGAAIVVVGLTVAAIQRRLHTPAAVAMAIAASLLATTGSWCGLRTPHTRAVAVVLGAFGLCALLRVTAWELAASAGERASPSLYGVSRGIATTAVVFEALGQLAAAAWLGTRPLLSSRILSNLAIAGAFIVTWGAARGAENGAPLWQAALHTALADASGLPRPYGLAAVATFLTAAGIFLSLVALLQRAQVAAVVCALALSLIARGSFDVPLRALAIAAASLWTILTMLDERAMWVLLTGGRPRKPSASPPLQEGATPASAPDQAKPPNPAQ